MTTADITWSFRRAIAAVICLSVLGAVAGCENLGRNGPPPGPCHAGLAWFSFSVYSTNASKLMNVSVDAIDQFGGKGLPGGEVYPFEKTGVASPYSHFICFQPGLVMTANIRGSLVEPDEHEVLGCDVRNQAGTLIPAAGGAAKGDRSVVCSYAGGVPGVTAWTAIPEVPK